MVEDLLRSDGVHKDLLGRFFQPERRQDVVLLQHEVPVNPVSRLVLLNHESLVLHAAASCQPRRTMLPYCQYSDKARGADESRS